MYLGSIWSWASPDSNKTSIAHTPAGPLKFNLQGNNIDNALLEDQIPVEHHHVWVLAARLQSHPRHNHQNGWKFHLSKPKAGRSCTFLFNNHTFPEKKQLKNLMLWNFFQKNPFNQKKHGNVLVSSHDSSGCVNNRTKKKKLPSEGPTWQELPVPFPWHVDPRTRKGVFFFLFLFWEDLRFKPNPMLKRRVTWCAGV